MKRNMDLIRKILLAVADQPGATGKLSSLEGYTDEEFGYHACLLLDAGLAEGMELPPEKEAVLYNLTWSGHDFVEAARDESRWRKGMKIIKEKGGAFTLDMIKGVLLGIAKDALVG